MKRGGSGDEGEKLVFRKTRQVSKCGYSLKFISDPTPPPRLTTEYMKGYIAGVFIGDGSICSYPHKRSLLTRLAMKDPEALIRSAKFLSKLGIGKI